MNKNQLAAAIADRTDGATQAQARAFLDSLAAVVGETLAAGDSVTVPGFGTFERKFSAARTATSPLTGGKVEVPARYRATFKAGSHLKAAVNPEAGQ